MAGYVGNIPVPQGTQTRQSFTATASQTSFPTIGYTAGFIDVYLNGIKLVSGTDFTASNGSDVVLATAAAADDVLDVVIFDTFDTSSGNFNNSTFTSSTLKSNVTLKNDTEQDTDGGRASKIIYQGEQSGGEISTLAEIEAAHDGTADDEKGDLIFRTNDGSDGTSPTERVRIDSDGNVGLGSSSPTTYVDGSAGSTLVLESSGTDRGALVFASECTGGANELLGLINFTDTANTTSNKRSAAIRGVRGSGDANAYLTFTTDNTERMRIDSDGDVGIGNTDPQSRVHLLSDNTGFVASNGAGIKGIQASLSSGNTENVYLYTSSGNGWSGSTHVARLESFGCNKLEIGSQQATAISFGTNNTQRMHIGTGGSLNVMGVYNDTTTSSTNVNVASDGHIRRVVSSRRYKNTITDATHGLAELLTLRPVTYKGNNEDFVVGGLIAEEVHDAGLTEFVEYDDDGEPDSLAYSNMVSLCIKAIQEQQATITAQAAKIETLETEMTSVKSRLDALEAE